MQGLGEPVEEEQSTGDGGQSNGWISVAKDWSLELQRVKADSNYMLSNVRSTCDLADQVSGKVWELDLAQSRVNNTLLRIDAIVDRGNCVNGVKKALDLEDFKSAAKYINKFLQIDARLSRPGFLGPVSDLLRVPKYFRKNI